MYQANSEFPFSKLSLSGPSAMQGGGAYFAKMTLEGRPIRLQLPKALTKNGVVSTKRDCYIDLMYLRETEPVLIEWFENIENKCKELINEKKDLWFSSDLTKTDIDSMMSPLSRTYKGETYRLIRINIDTSKRNGATPCQIYDDSENKISDFTLINTDHNIIPLIFIEGVKFTSKSIDIEIKMVQMMLFTTNIDECLISYKTPTTDALKKKSVVDKLTDVESDSTFQIHKDLLDGNDQESIASQDISSNLVNEIKNVSLGEISELPDNVIFDDKIREVDIEIESSSKSINIKDPVILYKEMYKVAKEKLKRLKEESFLAFLEVKQIKTKYMMDDSSENENDDDDDDSLN